MKELSDINTMSIELVELITPMLVIMLALILTLMVRDFATNFINGIKFRMHSSFQEGDKCILDGDKAIILKIGFYETVLQIDNGRGVVWRFLPNERIKFHKLEKVIKDPPSLETT
jgi:hypothetical protein